MALSIGSQRELRVGVQ